MRCQFSRRGRPVELSRPGPSGRLSLLFASLIPLFATTIARAQIVLNVPPDPAPSSIESNTTLNLLPTGTLPPGFNAGATDGTSTDVIVNIMGGSTGQFSARAGSTLNVSAGSMGVFVDLFGGSTTNISGGTLGGLVNAITGSTVNISGGSMGDVFTAQSGSSLTVFGGDRKSVV